MNNKINNKTQLPLEILLIRHAESEINNLMDNTPNENKILAGATCWAQLTDKGINQSRLLGKYLKENYPVFDLIASSPYVRTQQTLRYSMEEVVGTDNLCRVLSKVQIAMDIREHYQGDWEGMKKSETGYFEYANKAFSDPEFFYKTRFPNGKSPEDVGQRAAEYIKREILNEGFTRVALFTHRGTITWLLHNLFNTSIDELYVKGAHNASVSRLYVDENKNMKYETNIFLPNKK